MNLAGLALRLSCVAFVAALASPVCLAAPTSRVATPAGSCSGGICLALTMTTDAPPACGTASTLTVAIGTAVNFCYTITNDSGVELDYHSLDDNIDGHIFWLMQEPLATGASYQYNRVVSIRADTTLDATWTAQDQEPGYTRTITSGGFVDISATGTALGIQNEGIAGLTLPFPFQLYGRNSTSLCVSSDGFAEFDLWPCPTYSFYASQSLPTTYMPAPALMPLWEELIVGTGEVYAATLGTAPNRRFIIEWKDRPPYGAIDGFTFEMILHEASGDVSFEYEDVDTEPPSWSNGSLATIGLQATSTLAEQFSYFTASVTSGSGIAWTPSPVQSFGASASASVTVGGPIMALAPAAVHVAVVSNNSTSAPMTISNSGNVALAWSITETEGRAPGTKGSTDNNPIPVFAEDISHSRFVSFDARNPSALDPIADTDYMLTGGDFVYNDATRLYAIDGESAAHRNMLVSVDTTTGETREIGIATPLGAATWTSLKWDRTTHTLYGVAADCTYTNSTLYTIDRGSGAATRIGPISTGGHNCIMTIAIDPAGHMYGIDLVNADSLVSIDKTTGHAERIGPLGVTADGNQATDFDDASGTLYWARYAEESPGVFVSEIRTINTSTGAATLVAPIGSGAPQLDAFAIGVVGNCASPTDIPWLSVSPASGTVAAGDSATVTIGIDAQSLAPGSYRATICVTGNDTDTPIEQLPVELTVIDANDVIFRNGFDGP